jgi:hypothetical protein
MLNNIKFIEYNENLTEDMLNTLIEDTTTVLTNCIANTEIYDKNYILKLGKYNCIGTNIYYYFGYSNIIKKNITKKNVNNLLCNILNRQDDKIIWSDIIIKYYNIYFNNYTNKQITVLNKLLEEIKILYFKIFKDIKLLDNKKYDLDIVNKSIYEYINDNLDIIVNKLFTKINVFYILSICFNNNNDYILVYEKEILDILKSYL